MNEELKWFYNNARHHPAGNSHLAAVRWEVCIGTISIAFASMAVNGKVVLPGYGPSTWVGKISHERQTGHNWIPTFVNLLDSRVIPLDSDVLGNWWLCIASNRLSVKAGWIWWQIIVIVPYNIDEIR